MTKHTLFLSLALAILLAPLAGCEPYPRYGDADSRDRHYSEADRDGHRGEIESRDRHYDVRVVFSDRDASYIRDYYSPRNPHGYPPGLAKQGKVPPGHARKLMRGEELPPDYRWQPLPHDLDSRLSRLPEGYVRVIIGADIAIMNVRTHVLVDLLQDITD